jgi:hypothetical protein
VLRDQLVNSLKFFGSFITAFLTDVVLPVAASRSLDSHCFDTFFFRRLVPCVSYLSYDVLSCRGPAVVVIYAKLYCQLLPFVTAVISPQATARCNETKFLLSIPQVDRLAGSMQ